MAFENNPNATATITLDDPVIIEPGYDVTRPALGIYSSNFSSSLDGWTETVGTPTFSGTLDWLSNGSNSGLVQRSIGGLTVGRAYTLTARFATNNTTAGNVRLGVTGMTYSTVTPPGIFTNFTVTYSFTASTTTHQIYAYSLPPVGGASTRMDQVSLIQNAWVEHIPPVTTNVAELSLSDGDLTLDSSRYPYAEASVEVPLTTDDLLERIEPGQRVSIDATTEGSWTKTYTPWVEQRRNLVNNPTPATTSGYSGPGAATVTADGFTITATVTTTPYIFSSPSSTGATFGRVYAFRAKIKALAAAGSVFTNVNVRPHKNTGNAYYSVTPAVTLDADGVEREIFFYWKATVNIPAAESFNLSIVGNGTGVVGTKYSMRDVMIEDVGTEIPTVDPAEYFAPSSPGEFQQTRFTGTVNASPSVLEARELDRVDWVPAAGLSADLVLRERKVSHDGKKITMSLASDEALLSTWADIVDNSTPRTYEASLRDLVNYVLAQLPGTLRNLEPNPTALSTGSAAPYGTRFGWARTWVGNGAENVLPFGTLARFTSSETGTVAGRGIDSYGNQDLTSPATTGDFVGGPTVTPGETITVSRYVRMNVATAGYLLGVRFHNGAGGWVGGTSFGEWMGAGAGTSWVRVSWTGVVPAGATRFSVSTRIQTVAVTPSTFLDVTGLLTERVGRVRDWHDEALQPGTANADVTARWTMNNEFTNPAPSSATGYTAGSGTSGILYGSGFGKTVMRWTAAGTGTSYLNIASAFSVRPGNIYTMAGDLASSVARNVGFMVRWTNNEGVIIRDEHLPTVATNASTMVRSSRQVVAPPTAAKASIFAYSLVNTAGQFHWVSSLMWYEGVQTVPYFSGATTNGGGYLYSWEGAVGDSVSTRVPADGVERLPEVFTWQAGQNAWDFLKPLVATAGFRLFCDEQRRWWLIDPVGYSIPGRFSARPDNAVEGTDTMDVDDEDNGVTGVVAIFKWTDPDGSSRTKKDAAGTPGKVKVLEFDRQYPGPGIAAAHLSKVQGLGRVQDVTVATDYSVRPGMEIQIDLPGTYAQLGTLTRVRWELTNGLMSLGSAGLRETPPGAIDLLSGTIDALTGTIDNL
ncbi:hypothetical protein CVS54_01365 [Microbacterium oxydans]|uniref:Minor tail protein n=1 Tax=Microbacterium oxydans TaxID=82380 RepID=A0A3S9WJ70_9MICO|nr:MULTISPECIES: hypothetical protein [Microbacterium]AZS40043.1 hypothetical protein CVS54_01365 [Microbacterium oxydans]